MRQLALSLALLSTPVAVQAAPPQTVYFPSADGKTEIVGYVFAPGAPAPHPAVVMLHGRAGPYSSNVNHGCTVVNRGSSSPCNASSLSKRHMMWGEYWSARGYLAIHIDSFGPRGKAHGFGRGTHDEADRDDVNERTVHPLDAQGALTYLQRRTDVDARRIFLQGWSNGASTTLNVMLLQVAPGFRAALAFYPGCGPRALVDQQRFAVGSPVTVFLGSDDEEVSPETCRTVLERARGRGAPIEVVLFQGASHDFDDPGKERQSVAANRAAAGESMDRAARFFGSFAR